MNPFEDGRESEIVSENRIETPSIDNKSELNPFEDDDDDGESEVTPSVSITPSGSETKRADPSPQMELADYNAGNGSVIGTKRIESKRVSNPIHPNTNDAIVANDVGSSSLPPLVNLEEGLGPFNEHNIDAPGELIPFVRERIDIPKQLLNRHLLAGEKVAAEFDIFYNERRLGKHARIFLCLMTGGMYLFYLFIIWLWRSLKKYCCIGDSYHKRGKLVLTSNGRVLFWALRTEVKKNIIEERAHYDIFQCVQVCSVKDLKQMKISYYDSGLLCDFCCKEFRSALELTFFAFHSDESATLRIDHPMTFISVVRRFITNADVTVFNHTFTAPYVVSIVSTSFDKLSTEHKYDRGQEALEYLVGISHAISSYANSFSESSVQDAFIPSKSHRLGSFDTAMLPARDIPGVREVCKEWHGFHLVTDTEIDQISIPLRWMPLIGDEEIITAAGEPYFASLWEKVLCVVTLSAYYWFVLRKRMMQSNAYVLTTKRIVHVSLHQRHGKVPVSMGNVTMDVVSYFPGKDISGGYIRTFGKRIISALQTESGSIVLSLPNTHETMQFTWSMHRTTSREQPLESSVADLHKQLPENIAPYFDVRAGLRRVQSVVSKISSEVLPLLHDETIVHKVEGQERYAPCCVTSSRSANSTNVIIQAFGQLNCCFAMIGLSIVAIWENIACFRNCMSASKWQDIGNLTYFCNFNEADLCSPFWASIVKCLTFCTRPLLQSSDVFLTTNSVFYVSVTRPNRWVSANSRQRDAYFVCWVPVRRLVGFRSAITANGAHTVHPCCCGLCFLLPDCHGRAKYSIELLTSNGYSMSVSGKEAGKNWLADEEYVKAVTMIGVVHSQAIGTHEAFPDRI